MFSLEDASAVISTLAILGTAVYAIFRSGSFVRSIVEGLSALGSKFDILIRDFEAFKRDDNKIHAKVDRLLVIHDQRLAALEKFKSQTERQSKSGTGSG